MGKLVAGGKDLSIKDLLMFRTLNQGFRVRNMSYYNTSLVIYSNTVME
jgi:hypothetical protein